MAALIDTPPAHHYDIRGLPPSAMLVFEDRQGLQCYIADVSVPFVTDASMSDSSQTPATGSSTTSLVPTDEQLVANWQAEQRDLLLDGDFMLILDEITTYAATNPLLNTSADQINWSLNIFGKVLNKVLPSQIYIKDFTSLMIRLVEIVYSKNNLTHADSQKKWILNQFEIFAYVLYKNATTVEELQERASVISGADALVDPLLGVDLINHLSDQEVELINSGDYHPLIHKIITHAAKNSPLTIPEDQRNWSLIMLGEVVNNVIQQDQVKINDYPSLLIKLMEVAASNTVLKRGSSKKEWVLDQFGMIFDTLYEGSPDEDLVRKHDYLDAAGSIIDAAKAMYNQNVTATSSHHLNQHQGPHSAYFAPHAVTSPPAPVVINSNPLTDPTAFTLEAIQQISPRVTNQLTTTSTNLEGSLAGANRLSNLAPIITNILELLPSVTNLDSTTLVAIEIGVVEGVLTITLPLIPGGAVYLPIALPLVPFAVKAINLAALELFDLGKEIFEEIENK